MPFYLLATHDRSRGNRVADGSRRVFISQINSRMRATAARTLVAILTGPAFRTLPRHKCVQLGEVLPRRRAGEKLGPCFVSQFVLLSSLHLTYLFWPEESNIRKHASPSRQPMQLWGPSGCLCVSARRLLTTLLGVSSISLLTKTVAIFSPWRPSPETSCSRVVIGEIARLCSAGRTAAPEVPQPPARRLIELGIGFLS